MVRVTLQGIPNWLWWGSRWGWAGVGTRVGCGDDAVGCKVATGAGVDAGLVPGLVRSWLQGLVVGSDTDLLRNLARALQS